METCLHVYSPGSPNMRTIDGNQGKFQSIKVVSRILSDKLPDGSSKLAFLHVSI